MRELDEIERLSAIGAVGVAGLLALARNNDEEVRMRSIEALAEYADQVEVMVAVRAALDDEDELVRVASLEIVGDYKDAGSYDAVLAHLSDSSALVRGNAAIALALIGRADVIPIVTARLEAGTDNRERVDYLIALIALGERSLTSDYLALIADPDYQVRCAVANRAVQFDDLMAGWELCEIFRQALTVERTVAARSSLEEALNILCNE